MTTQKRILLRLAKTIFLGVFSMSTLPTAFAQEATTPTAAAASTTTSTAPDQWQQCATENNITLPAKDSGQKLSKTDLGKMIACIEPKREAQAALCKESSKGREAFHACMKAAGFNHFHGHHKHGNQQAHSESQT